MKLKIKDAMRKVQDKLNIIVNTRLKHNNTNTTVYIIIKTILIILFMVYGLDLIDNFLLADLNVDNLSTYSNW